MTSTPPLFVWKDGVKVATILGECFEIEPKVFRCQVSAFIPEDAGYEIYPDVHAGKKMSVLWNGCEFIDITIDFSFVETGYSSDS